LVDPDLKVEEINRRAISFAGRRPDSGSNISDRGDRREVHEVESVRICPFIPDVEITDPRYGVGGPVDQEGKGDWGGRLAHDPVGERLVDHRPVRRDTRSR
jgi:hypothetical protein